MYPIFLALSFLHQELPVRNHYLQVRETTTVQKLLSRISSKEKTYVASKSLRNQRVTLSIKNIEPGKIIDILIQILSHSNTEPYLYELHDGTDKNTFILTTNAEYKKEEKRSLEYPKKQLALILRNTRDYIRKNENYVYGTDSYPLTEEPHRTILKNLSDAQINDLIEGKRISVSEYIPKQMIVNYNKMFSIENLNTKNIIGNDFKPKGGKLEEGPFKQPFFRVKFQQKNNFKFNIGIEGAVYGVPPQGIWNDTYFTIDPFQYCKNPTSSLASATPESIQHLPHEKQFDLSELFNKETTSEMRSDLGFLLRKISEITNINIAEEHFISRNYNADPSKKVEFLLKKGNIREIFEYIWRNYNYITNLHNDIYYLWSPVWAFEKRSDISDQDLDYWKNLKEKQGGSFSLNQWTQIASKYNNYQLQDTFYREIPTNFSDPGKTIACFELLRFIGKISPEIWQKLREEGEVKWQNLPFDTRASLDYSTMEDINWFDPPVELTYSELMNCTGALRYSKSLRGQDSEMVVLSVNTQDGTNIFSFSVSGIILPKKR